MTTIDTSATSAIGAEKVHTDHATLRDVRDLFQQRELGRLLGGRAIFAGGSATFESGAPTVTVTATTAHGYRVAIEAVGDGRLQNGKAYADRCHMLMEVRDHRIHAVREYMDSTHVAEVFAGTEVETG